MEWLFGRKKTPAEILKESQRAIKKSMRELDRERKTLENQEKTVVADIKKSAAAGQNAVMRIQAKDLVRTQPSEKDDSDAEPAADGVHDYSEHEINQHNGKLAEECHQGNGPDEQVDELAADAINHARV